MPRWKRWFADDGSAPLEFITAGLILMVPLVYLIVAMSALQGPRSPPREMAARPPGVRSSALQSGGRAGLGPGRPVRAGRLRNPRGCSEPRLQLPSRPAELPDPLGHGHRHGAGPDRASLFPSFLGLDAATSVPFEAAATQTVSRFWGSGVSS